MTDANILDGDILKAGDTQPNLRIQLLQDGETRDLENWVPRVRVRNTQTDEVVVSSSANIADAKNGIIEYNWTSGDTSEAALYEAEVTIEKSGEAITFPNDGYVDITIVPVIE